jgi:ribosome-associated toxin RatA of RatAB toxin-antitoxin module
LAGTIKSRILRIRRGATLLGAVMLTLLARHSAAQEVSVTTHAQGRAVQVRAEATLHVPHALIWQTLTDYSHLADFIPGMTLSRVVERRGDIAIVEQEGAARFLVFAHPIRAIVESIEQPPASISVRILEGNLKQLAGQYRIEPLGSGPAGFVLRWEGVVEPQTPVPGIISAAMMRANVAKQFLGMVKEIERRYALQHQALAR